MADIGIIFSGEDSPSTDTSHYISLLPEVCRSVYFWAILYMIRSM